MGLSPRVRGNRLRRSPGTRCGGSIPARAGEPWLSKLWWRVCPVYPRACGGTEIGNMGFTTADGLSPRVRGNHRPLVRVQLPRRSIPARAGEPRRFFWWWSPGWVYPRACGGTWEGFGRFGRRIGLSPRVRGNQPGHPAVQVPLRSIPARAGEPQDRFSHRWQMWVYPRACGGTASAASGYWAWRGLSPRVRGNRVTTTTALPPDRSIPARAGEPAGGTIGG